MNGCPTTSKGFRPVFPVQSFVQTICGMPGATAAGRSSTLTAHTAIRLMLLSFPHLTWFTDLVAQDRSINIAYCRQTTALNHTPGVGIHPCYSGLQATGHRAPRLVQPLPKTACYYIGCAENIMSFASCFGFLHILIHGKGVHRYGTVFPRNTGGLNSIRSLLRRRTARLSGTSLAQRETSMPCRAAERVKKRGLAVESILCSGDPGFARRDIHSEKEARMDATSPLCRSAVRALRESISISAHFTVPCPPEEAEKMRRLCRVPVRVCARMTCCTRRLVSPGGIPAFLRRS